jgi:hypothetical protein
MGEKRSEYRDLVAKPECMRALGRPRRMWEVLILTWILQK